MHWSFALYIVKLQNIYLLGDCQLGNVMVMQLVEYNVVCLCWC